MSSTVPEQPQISSKYTAPRRPSAPFVHPIPLPLPGSSTTSYSHTPELPRFALGGEPSPGLSLRHVAAGHAPYSSSTPILNPSIAWSSPALLVININKSLKHVRSTSGQPDDMNAPATHPPCSEIRMCMGDYQWLADLRKSDGTCITVGDICQELLGAISVRVPKEELAAMDQYVQDAAHSAFKARMKALPEAHKEQQYSRGIRRVDVLNATRYTRIIGLSVHPQYQGLWLVNLA